MRLSPGWADSSADTVGDTLGAIGPASAVPLEAPQLLDSDVDPYSHRVRALAADLDPNATPVSGPPHEEKDPDATPLLAIAVADVKEDIIDPPPAPHEEPRPDRVDRDHRAEARAYRTCSRIPRTISTASRASGPR